MGINFSRTRDPERCRHSELINDDVMERENESEDEYQEAQESVLSPAQEMIEFRKELATKREQRRQIIAKHSMEKENLRKSLLAQVQSNERIVNENKFLREQLEKHGINVPETAETQTANSEGPISVLMVDLDNLREHNRRLHRDLAETNVALQSANADMVHLQGMNIESMKQISALKEVVAVSKTMMQIRESQMNELKAKLSQIEASLADREASLLSTDLRSEYERQLHNIRTLRSLYEERARLADVTRSQLARELEEHKVLTAVETSRCKELAERVSELEVELAQMSAASDKKDELISLSREETRVLRAEMSTVNKLFSQMLLGHKSHQDLDKLVSRLEEHHGILAHMVAKDGAEASSALPKLLLDLLGQLDPDKSEEKKDNSKESSLNTTAEEIVDNLPKVWRVLMELLSHQSGADKNPQELHPSTCYKPVETSSGTRMVPSVSQTYIRLKDLIVEKLSLTKEMSKMKQLNTHLESRLEEQERRLCLVTSELSKTWHVVGKLRRHHHQLHTHEKILRYELQQKRKMLNELKEELEFCKEKWDRAREKNCESEKEMTKLRTEFSERRKKIVKLSNNSGESGYSDEKQTEDDSTESNDDSVHTDDLPLRSKKRIRKTIEREDPITGSLNVEDLPSDDLDADENDDFSTSESCISDNCINSLIIKESDEINEKSIEKKEVSFHSPSNESTQQSKMLITTQDKLTGIEESSSHSLHETINVSDFKENGKKTTKILKCKNKSENIVDTEDMLEKDNSNILCANSEKQGLFNTNETKEDYAIAGSSRMVEPREILQIEKLENREQKLEHVEESQNFQITLQPELKSKISVEAGNISTKIRNENEDETIISVVEYPVDFFINNASTSYAPLTQAETSRNENSRSSISFESTVNVSTNLIDPKEILNNIRKQDERLAKRDERMRNLEEGCSSLLVIAKNTSLIGSEIEARLDSLHNKATEIQTNLDEDSESAQVPGETYFNEGKKYDNVEETQSDSSATQGKPSTSASSMDHEARFAARDERFKRLEEQAKSLVDKVNDTNTKSVKITYKLQELHNIYGSDSRSQNSEDENEVDEDVQDTESD